MRFLLIDDDEHWLRTLARLTEHRGHEVHTANSVTQGIELGLATCPHAIISDYWIGDDQADALLRALGSTLPDAVLVVLTGDPTVTLPPDLASVPVLHKSGGVSNLLADIERRAEAARALGTRAKR